MSIQRSNSLGRSQGKQFIEHSFLLNTVSNPNQAPQNLMKFAGCWNDVPDEIYAEWLDDISLRRQQAFSQRQNREASFD